MTGEFAFTTQDLKSPRSVEALIARVTAEETAPAAAGS